jgi:hypothetical protein
MSPPPQADCTTAAVGMAERDAPKRLGQRGRVESRLRLGAVDDTAARTTVVLGTSAPDDIPFTSALDDVQQNDQTVRARRWARHRRRIAQRKGVLRDAAGVERLRRPKFDFRPRLRPADLAWGRRCYVEGALSSPLAGYHTRFEHGGRRSDSAMQPKPAGRPSGSRRCVAG